MGLRISCQESPTEKVGKGRKKNVCTLSKSQATRGIDNVPGIGGKVSSSRWAVTGRTELVIHGLGIHRFFIYSDPVKTVKGGFVYA